MDSASQNARSQKRRRISSSNSGSPVTPAATTGSSGLVTAQPGLSPTESAPDSNTSAKTRKVSRACDFCKSRKARCSGTQPCDKCIDRGKICLYDAKYTRGRPPTPPRRTSKPETIVSVQSLSTNDHESSTVLPMDLAPVAQVSCQEDAPPSRASPELAMAEIEGQVYDPTSGLTFLHRAWKRLLTSRVNAESEEARSFALSQPLTMAGDNPLPGVNTETAPEFPDPAESRRLVALYFDVCIATYRFLHRPSVEEWLAMVEKNMQEKHPMSRGIGHAKASIVLVALAVAVAHREKSNGFSSVEKETNALTLSDHLFGLAIKLTDDETGYPQLESAQARLVQVLYLLTTSRFNRAWFVFGTALQLISALGLHRRVKLKSRPTARAADYIHRQCGLRTFWTAYILDNYLGLVFGRPRHFHDEDIDQELPDRANDEDMTSERSGTMHGQPENCHVDGLICHIQIARLIGYISREVYAVRDLSEDERVIAAHRLVQRVKEWRANLPLHLGSIPPSILIPSYRRQATVLRLAYSHAIMHANRLFLSGSSTAIYDTSATECIDAAKVVLDTVDNLAQEGPIFHAFWWTHYVTFCALIIVYVWEIQKRRTGRAIDMEDQKGVGLREKAERCHRHLAQATATNSPSRRYALILDEFREAASKPQPRPQPNFSMPLQEASTLNNPTGQNLVGMAPANTLGGVSAEIAMGYDLNLLDEWQTSDWLDLDSSAFWPQDDLSAFVI